MCDTSLNLPKFLSMYSRRPSKLGFFPLSSVLENYKFTKKLATVGNVMRIRIIASKFSTTGNLICRGLPSGIQKIVVLKVYPCRESGVHLQWSSALKCVLFSPGRFRVISTGQIQIINEVWFSQMLCYMLTIMVWGWFLKRFSMNAKFVDYRG